MTLTVEQVWETKVGLMAVAGMNGSGYRVGYVAVESDHPLFGVHYSHEVDLLFRPPTRPDCLLTVHGGLTYSGDSDTDYPIKSETPLWWFGFDCGHCDDAPSPEWLELMKGVMPGMAEMYSSLGGVHRTLEFVIEECEELARQLVEGPFSDD